MIPGCGNCSLNYYGTALVATHSVYCYRHVLFQIVLFSEYLPSIGATLGAYPVRKLGLGTLGAGGETRCAKRTMRATLTPA